MSAWVPIYANYAEDRHNTMVVRKSWAELTWVSYIAEMDDTLRQALTTWPMPTSPTNG